MNNILLIAILAGLSVLTACSDDNGGNSPLTTVHLEGAIGLSTRTVIGSDYEKDLDVCFARQDATGATSETYGAWSVCKAVRNGGKGNRPVVFDKAQFYPSAGSNIRLHGYYPATGEGNAATGRVVFTIDGMTDVMATGRLSGNSFSPLGTCTFRHLLTQLSLVCYSDRPDGWGEIARIEATAVHTRQQLDWQSVSPVLSDASSAEEIKAVAVQGISGLPIPRVEEGEELPEAQGYILLPVSPGPLELEVTTTKDGNGNVGEATCRISVRVEGDFLPGKRHVVSLFFTGGGQIRATSVGVEEWTDRDAGEIPI